jgi:hypothetical protein
MLIEKTRTTFDPIAYPLASVTGGATKAGVVIDFDAKNQMVETNQVLEVYVSKAAEVGVTVEGENTTEHEPKLQIKIYSGDDPDSLSVVQSSEVFDADDLIEGFILYKAALPDKCGQYVRVDLVNPVEDNDFAQGEVVGTVRPL